MTLGEFIQVLWKIVEDNPENFKAEIYAGGCQYIDLSKYRKDDDGSINLGDID